MQTTPATSAVAAPRDDIPSLFEGQRLVPLLLYLFLYAAVVTAILALFTVIFRLALPGTVTDTDTSATFAAEAIYFFALFAYVLIKHRRAASRST